MTKSYSVVNFTEHKKERQTVAKALPKSAPVMLQEQTLQTAALRKLSPRLRELVAMLEYARPSRSDTEEHFIRSYIDTLPNVRTDGFGNRIVQVGRNKPTIAWSCHTDTVHYDEGIQAIEINKDGDLELDWNSDASCLGADCTVGVWLMRRLILAGKPGLYVFHRDEESGGQGSTWIASNTPELVDGIDAMIALDRRGYTSVITEQTTGRTASAAFALSLAEQLNAAPGLRANYKPDDGGIFTDSAFYNHLVPECTNISVGYFNQHSRSETLDHVFADNLLLALLKLDYGKLKIARDPQAGTGRSYYGYYYYRGADYDYEMDSHWREQLGETSGGTKTTCSAWEPGVDIELVDMIRRNPEATARLLGYWDITPSDLREAIRDYEEEQG